MNLFGLLVSAHSGAALRNIARQFSVSENDVYIVAQTVVPVLGQGFSRNSMTTEGLVELLRALGTNRYLRYYGDPKIFANAHVKFDGIAILNHAIPSSKARLNLRAEIVGKTSLRVEVIEEILPLIASLTMGALDQKLRGKLGLLVRSVQRAPEADDQIQNPFRAAVHLLAGLESSNTEYRQNRPATDISRLSFTDKLSSVLFWPPTKISQRLQPDH